MELAQLKEFVKQGESEQVEFKKSTANLSTAMQTVCAFLNSDHGGVVIFGVEDNGKIVGQRVTDKTRKDIATELNKLDPHEKIKIDYVSVSDDLHVIYFAVKPGENAPYMYDGRSFMRNQSTTVRMPRDESIYLYNKSNPTAWEKSTHNDCTIHDLDKKRIKEIVRMAISEGRLPESSAALSIPAILKKLGLTVGEKLTNAAVILFCKDEDKEFMQSSMKLARFKGTTKSEFLDTKMYRANAFDLYEAADKFLFFVLPVAARIVPGRAERLETPAIPLAVWREALVNALVHRDYSYPGGSLDVAVYDDRVNISNPGFMPHDLDIKELTKEHKSVARNPLIANVFYICGKIERWGRGTLDMIQDCKKAGNPIPRFEEAGGGFSVTLLLKEPIRTVIYEEPSESFIAALTDRQKAILVILKNGPLKTMEIKALLKERITPRTLQIDLAKLKKLGLIKSAGKSTATIWLLF